VTLRTIAPALALVLAAALSPAPSFARGGPDAEQRNQAFQELREAREKKGDTGPGSFFGSIFGGDDQKIETAEQPTGTGTN